MVPAQPEFSLGAFLTYFYVMMGPLRVVGPFAEMTRNMDRGTRIRLAFSGVALSTVGLFAAAYLGGSTIDRWHVSVGALTLVAGITLFCVALANVLQLPIGTNAAPPKESSSSMELAFYLFSVIVTPYGVAALLVFRALQPHSYGQIDLAFLIVMALNFVVMLFAQTILRFAGLVLKLLGAVLSVLQVALSVQIIMYGLHLLRTSG